MKVYLLYRSKDLLCVCNSKERAIEMAEDDAASLLLFEKYGEASAFRENLSECTDACIHGVRYTIIKEEVY